MDENEFHFRNEILTEEQRFIRDCVIPFMDRMRAHFDEQAHVMALILEALIPEGCGHENWEEVTTSGAPHRTFHCGEPGCTEQKTEPWD